MPRRESLGVWLYGRRIAEFNSPKPWIVECSYTEEALDAWPANIPLLSCSLPLGARRQNATVFAAGLLPEGQHRQSVAAAMGVPVTDVHALLARLGRDVAGAVVISSEPPSAQSGAFEPYTTASLEEEVLGLPDRPLAIYEDSELSLPGIQDKLLLVKLEDGRWARPIGGLPSTHILKIDDRFHPGLIEAEASCLSLARAAGLTKVEASLETIGDIPCMIVSRFDRVSHSNGMVDRLHQEDACQALARDPEAQQGRGRYQWAGGPSLSEIADLLDRYSASPVEELDRLVSLVTFNAIIGNADAHGRNVSMLHPSPEEITLAPVYDTVPTLLWPKLRTDLAMTISGITSLRTVTSEAVVAEARRWHHDPRSAQRVSIETAERLIETSSQVELREDVRHLVQARARRFLEGAPLGD